MSLKLHHLRPAPGAKTEKTRVGRGEGSKGKTAGRGTKGTGARKNVPQNFEGGQMPIHMRLPKLKGFKNPFRVEFQVVNVGRVAELFPKGGDVTVADLVAAGAVRDGALVKVLGNGDVPVALKVSANAFSASAKAKLASLYPEGGEVTVADLIAKGAVRDGHLVKVLGNGELTVALQVSANAFSATAKEKIEKAGGTATQL